MMTDTTATEDLQTALRSGHAMLAYQDRQEVCRYANRAYGTRRRRWVAASWQRAFPGSVRLVRL